MIFFLRASLSIKLIFPDDTKSINVGSVVIKVFLEFKMVIFLKNALSNENLECLL